MLSVLVVLATVLLGATPAWAHGPVNPEASDYLARVVSTPAGVSARTVDGDLRLWLRVKPGPTVTVLDYQGAPYLRFSPRGIEVNTRSALYDLNEIPPQAPPTTIQRGVRPTWHRISTGESYEWHDGRLHALALALAAPGTRMLGRWQIPLRVDGRPAAIVGELERLPPPSLAWLWPLAVVLAALPALRRLRDRRLERRWVLGLAWVALVASVILAVGEGFHGRPSLSTGRLIVLGLELAIVAWAAWRLIVGRDSSWVRAVIALLALYRAVAGIPVLFRGEVLLALPAGVARAAVAACLATGIGLGLLLLLELAEPSERARVAHAES